MPYVYLDDDDGTIVDDAGVELLSTPIEKPVAKKPARRKK